MKADGAVELQDPFLFYAVMSKIQGFCNEKLSPICFIINNLGYVFIAGRGSFEEKNLREVGIRQIRLIYI